MTYRGIKRAKVIIKGWIISLLVVMIAGVVGNIVYIIKSHDDFKPKAYYCTITIEEVELLEKWEYKGLITELFDTPHIYVEGNLKKQSLDGYARPLIRLVKIEADLCNYSYAYTLAHELVHVKYQTGNETWTSYKSFIILYESGSSALRHIALLYAQDQLGGLYEGTEYDCSYYIADYLNLLEG